MAGVLDSVNQRTQLVGQNRLELLLFKLNNSKHRYGINVFKVKEVLQCPRLNSQEPDQEQGSRKGWIWSKLKFRRPHRVHHPVYPMSPNRLLFRY